ncbi:MAG TPA: hypothetical protein VMT28_05660 [Terriglobales bacterium]|jgi:hypothetical protein|nr:hypothetical protein [Terriglobales bacterium]
MNATFKAVTAALALVVFAALCALPASAGCSPFPGSKSGGHLQKQSWDGQAELQPGSLTLVSDHANLDPIVGFWQFTFVSDGQTIDAGYVQWHSDRTEIMNSSRDPRTQSFCMGVWKKVGPGHYKLNHFALSWDGNGNEIGPANIREDITLDRAIKSYSGTFTLDQYDLSGNLLVHLEGDVSATRITVDTPPSRLN